MRKKRTIRLTYALLILIAAALITMVATTLSQLETKDISMDVTVANYTGFNVDNDSIHFGAIMPGGHGMRNITLNNSGGRACTVTIQFLGEFADWVRASENYITLAGHEEQVISVRVSIPPETDYGNYTGVLRLISARGCLA